MVEKTIAQRVLEGRESELRLKDEFLNNCFDHLVERWMKGIMSAPPAQQEQILEAKRQIDAITSVRKELKVLMDDGYIAQKESEDG